MQRSALFGTRDTRHNASRWSVIPRAAGWSWRCSCGCGRRARSCPARHAHAVNHV